MRLWKEILTHIGINAERLRIEWVSAAEGVRFATIITEFTAQLQELGPLWDAKGEDAERLRLRLASAKALVPYFKLVKSNKLAGSLDSIRTEADEIFNQKEIERLYRGLVEEKLVLNEIMCLLKEKQYSVEEISEVLHLSRSEVSKCLGIAAKKRLIRWASGGFTAALAGGGPTKT